MQAVSSGSAGRRLARRTVVAYLLGDDGVSTARHRFGNVVRRTSSDHADPQQADEQQKPGEPRRTAQGFQPERH
jgi:hypothetical protein